MGLLAATWCRPSGVAIWVSDIARLPIPTLRKTIRTSHPTRYGQERQGGCQHSSAPPRRWKTTGTSWNYRKRDRSWRREALRAWATHLDAAKSSGWRRKSRPRSAGARHQSCIDLLKALPGLRAQRQCCTARPCIQTTGQPEGAGLPWTDRQKFPRRRNGRSSVPPRRAVVLGEALPDAEKAYAIVIAGKSSHFYEQSLYRTAGRCSNSR